MLQTVPYTLEELLRERREGAVRALVRVVGYALGRGASSEDVGRFLYESYALSGEYERWLRADGPQNAAAFASRHMLARWGLCDDVQVTSNELGYTVESVSMLDRHEAVLGFHGVSRMDLEACMETYWRMAGRHFGLDVTYTIGNDRDWALVRAPGKATSGPQEVVWPVLTPEALASHRRISLATGITFSIGYAKHAGDEPEDLGRFFYQVWEGSGHYDRLRDRWGYGNAHAYSQSLAQSRQVLYTRTEMYEDLDGYTISSPSWATEIPQVMGTFGVLPDDVYRYYEGGGIAACAKLGLQYADRSEDRFHRVWIRSRG